MSVMYVIEVQGKCTWHRRSYTSFAVSVTGLQRQRVGIEEKRRELQSKQIADVRQRW